MGTINFAVTESTITLAYDGKNFRINRRLIKNDEPVETEVSKKIMQAIRAKQLDSNTSPIPAIVDLAEALKGSPFIIVNGVVFIDGVEAPSIISKRILDYKNEGIPYESIVNFHRNVLKNPSRSAQEELFLFLEHNGHPFTEEGYFLAYKAVRPDYYSKYNYAQGSDKNVLNAPQTWVEMHREEVDSNRDQTCSYGLHCANYSYARYNYGCDSDMMIEVIVDPKDVVSVPSDYNNKKMRVCRYFVVGPCEGEQTDLMYKEWDRQIDLNAPTNTVPEGDYEDGDDDLGKDDVFEIEMDLQEDDEEIVTALVNAEPIQEISTSVEETGYYKSYVNGANKKWIFEKYDSKTKKLTYKWIDPSLVDPNLSFVVARIEINKGDKVPVTWIPTGDLITNLWPMLKRVDSQDTLFTTVFQNSIDPNTPIKVIDELPENAIYIDTRKTDTRLNHLSQPRVNGKFAPRT